MISLAHAKRTDRLMKATTSLTVAEFEALAGPLSSVWNHAQAAQTAEGQPRRRQPGGGRKGTLTTIEAKLLFILLYYKAYPTQDVMGLLFGIKQGQVSAWVQRLSTVVGRLMELHKPARQGRQLRELLEAEPALREVIIDGTERRIRRPQHAGRQKRYCSGRKKRHVVKNVIVVGRGRVLWCSRTEPARKHDKKVAAQGRLRLPPEVTVLGDSGFDGLNAGAAGVVTPWRRRKMRKLHAKKRAFKRLRILRDEFRNRRRGMIDAVMQIGCALHNYRWDCRQSAAA